MRRGSSPTSCAIASLFRRRSPPDALFCLYNDHAMQAIDLFRENGIRVPADVCIATLADSPLSGPRAYDATVVTARALTTIAPDPDALSELGEPVARVARADEALPFAAVAVDGNVVRADRRIAPTDGVGAVLRYTAERADQRGA